MERGRTLAARIMNPSLLKQQASERANSDAPSAEDASPTVLPKVGIALVVEGEPPGIILRRVVAQRGFDVAIGNIAAAVRVFCVCYMVTVYISSFHFILSCAITPRFQRSLRFQRKRRVGGRSCRARRGSASHALRQTLSAASPRRRCRRKADQ